MINHRQNQRLKQKTKKITIKQMSKKRFEAFVGYTRHRLSDYTISEISWFSNENETLLGVVILDHTDLDYAAVILGRDESYRFRAIENECSFQDEKAATAWLINSLKLITSKGLSVFPQGDKCRIMDFFTPVVPTERLHIYFSILAQGKSFEPARELIRNMMPHFIDIDGNFTEQFQTTGFDSRLWELCIFAYLNEEQLEIDRHHSAPDFIVSKFEDRVAIEAVIVGRKPKNQATHFTDINTAKKHLIPNRDNFDIMPIRFGSSLYSKLQKNTGNCPMYKDYRSF